MATETTCPADVLAGRIRRLERNHAALLDDLGALIEERERGGDWASASIDSLNLVLDEIASVLAATRRRWEALR